MVSLSSDEALLQALRDVIVEIDVLYARTVAPEKAVFVEVVERYFKLINQAADRYLPEWREKDVEPDFAAVPELQEFVGNLPSELRERVPKWWQEE